MSDSDEKDKQIAILQLSVPLEEELNDRIAEMLKYLAMEQGFSLTGIARLLVECQRRMASDWVDIGRLRRSREAAEAALALRDTELQAWEEREAACCPEDVGFPEYIAVLTKQRDEFRTLSQIGVWHKDCRPNREMAARELQKSQAIIDKLADEITSLRAALALQAQELDKWRAVTEHEKDGAELIAAERSRQQRIEGWTPQHDDRHDDGSLAAAACCYAALGRRQCDGTIIRPASRVDPPGGWPFDEEWWKPKDDPIRNFVRAGALIAAEIDRLRRALPSAAAPVKEKP